MCRSVTLANVADEDRVGRAAITGGLPRTVTRNQLDNGNLRFFPAQNDNRGKGS